MLIAIYRRLLRADGKRHNGVQTEHVMDHAVYEMFALKYMEKLPIVEGEMDSSTSYEANGRSVMAVMKMLLEDVMTFYRRQRFTISRYDKWVITSQKEVW